MRTVRIESLAGLTWLLMVGLFMGCAALDSKPAKNDKHIIAGSVWYRERMLPPPGTEIYVALEDVDRLNVKADVVASTRFAPEGGPPWDFKLAYDPGRLRDRGRYALRVRIAVDDRLLFINTERIPAFDRETDAPVKIMVSRVAKSAPSSKPDAGLVNTYWKLTELNGKPAQLGVEKGELHMILTAEKNQVRGFSGCNRFSGTYRQKAGRLKFGPLAATMMACAEGMEQETSFFKVLGKTARYTIAGDNLTLFNSEEKSILRFKAVYVK